MKKKITLFFLFFLIFLNVNAIMVKGRQEFESRGQGFIKHYVVNPSVEYTKKEYRGKTKELALKYNWLIEMPIEEGFISFFKVDKKNFITVVQTKNILYYTSFMDVTQMNENVKDILDLVQKNKKGTNDLEKYVYFSTENKTFSKEKTSEKDNKFFILNNIESLKKEFENNEPRAIYNYSKENIFYVISGQIKKLDAGFSGDKYIIHMNNGSVIYIEASEKEKYFELEKNDWVYLKAKLPELIIGELNFSKGNILTPEEYLKIFNSVYQKK